MHMQKPKNVIYGSRILYASVILLPVLIIYFVTGSSGTKFDIELITVMMIPVAGWLYLVYLLSKGRFWVRSVFLALTIINALKILPIILTPEGLFGLLLLLPNATALYFLFRKDSNAWFAHYLMEENLARIAKRQKKEQI